ncbi:MAG: hypothetical protein WDO18_11785 [Acidobacteriota bacterium]
MRHRKALRDYGEGRRHDAIREGEALLGEDLDAQQRSRLLMLLGRAYYYPELRATGIV